jgi:hypothetical protein
MLEMVNEMLKIGADVVNVRNKLIAITGDKEIANIYVDVISELQNLIDTLEARYVDYVFSLSGYDDYHYIDLNVYHVFEDGISHILTEDIIKADLKSCWLFLVQPYNEGLTFKYHI